MQAKIVTMLLSAMLLSTGVTGTQQIKSTDITEPVTRESEVKYKQESNFTVTIPKKIALGSDKTAEYAVTVSGSVGANEKVSVTPNSTFTMNETSNRKTAVTGTATQEDTVWDYTQIEASEAKNGNVTASGLTAGDWSGSLTFNINLNAEYAIGDDVELTWDNLGEYGIPTEGDVVIPEMVLGSDGMKHKVTSIGDAFRNTDITSIIIPDNVTNIGSYAFYNCANLNTITMSNSLTAIGNEAFGQCVSLTNMTLPDTITTIGDMAFSECTNLQNINIPNGIQTIHMGMFTNCRQLKTITIPDTVTEIKGNAFSECNRLKEINIPDSITSIGTGAFSYCTNITEIHISKNMKTIEAATFEYCTSLTNIEIPENITQIQESAFTNCKSLKNINLPSKMNIISKSTFEGCTALETITMPENS